MDERHQASPPAAPDRVLLQEQPKPLGLSGLSGPSPGLSVTSPAPGTVFDRICDRLFLLGLLGAISFLLWLPVFPSGDGPVHLYYANVLSSLVHHQPGYAHDYAIRHLFAPYLVHYLALISFERFTTPPLAEKLFLAIIFLTQAFGFRFLARTLGTACVTSAGDATRATSPAIACLWMLPLLFSWSAGGGFLNCCFATGVVLWSFGVWTLLDGNPRQSTSPMPGARLGSLLAAHICLLAVLVLSHPVPLLVLLLFTASDLLLRLLHCRSLASAWQSLAPQIGAFALTCLAFLFPAMLAQKGQAAAVLPEIGFHIDVLGELAAGMRLGYFAGLNLHTAAGWLAILARAMLVAIVPGVAALLGYAKWQSRLLPPAPAPRVRQELAPDLMQASAPAPDRTAFLPRTPAGRLLLISLLYLAATVWFPRSLNHSFFFPQRMWDIVWLLVLACGSSAALSPRAQRWLAGAGLAAVVLTAATGLPALTRIARAQAQIASIPLPAGARGLLLGSHATIEGHGAATTYPVYFWAGARAFAASHAVLLNSPWLGLTILPLKDAPGPQIAATASRPAVPSQALLDQGFPSLYSENPVLLAALLVNDLAERDQILARAGFLLYVDPASSSIPLALLGSHPDAWQCQAYLSATLCTRRQ